MQRFIKLFFLDLLESFSEKYGTRSGLGFLHFNVVGCNSPGIWLV